MNKVWEPEDPNIRAACEWFRKEGHQVRSPKNKDLADVFWADSIMVVVQVNPSRFPAQINRYRRALIVEESHRYGCYKSAVVAKVQAVQGEAPKVIKVKNLPNHFGHPSHVAQKAKDVPDAPK